MNFKVEKRSNLVWNIILFTLLSSAFLHIAISLWENKSALQISTLMLFVRDHKYFLLLLIPVVVSMYIPSKVSKLLYVFVCLYVTGKVTSLIVDDFNKLILFMLFFYILLAHYFFILWKNELEEPFYNPHISNRDIIHLQKIKVPIQCMSHDDKELGLGFLTNWGPRGCFMRFVGPYSIDNDKVVVKIDFLGRTFVAEGSIVSTWREVGGVGIKFSEDIKYTGVTFSWSDFYSVIYDLGYIPEYLV